MVQYSPAWKALRGELLRLSGGNPTKEQVWLLLGENHWLCGKLSTLNLPPLTITECIFRLAHTISLIAPTSISAWELRDFLHLVALHAHDAQVGVTALQASSPRGLNARITLLRMIDAFPPQQRAVLALHLKQVSLTDSARILRLSTYATYSIWREATLRLAENLSAS